MKGLFNGQSTAHAGMSPHLAFSSLSYIGRCCYDVSALVAVEEVPRTKLVFETGEHEIAQMIDTGGDILAEMHAQRSPLAL